MSGEPNWCALPPFTTRGSTSPATPSGRGFNPTMNQKWKRTPQNRVRFHFWWRRRELNPRPRIARAGRLRVYLRLLDLASRSSPELDPQNASPLGFPTGARAVRRAVAGC